MPSTLKSIPLTRQIFKNHKYELLFFTYAPSAVEASSKYIISANPILYFNKVITNFNDYTPQQLQTKRFRITPKNLYTTISFFNDIIKWFYDPNMKDLFLIGNDNNLIFNGDYTKLNKMTDRGYFDNDVMKAFPAVVSDFSGTPAEGVHLFINVIENQIDITLSELEHILGILSNFNFYSETLLSIEAIRYTLLLNNGTVPPFQPNGFQK